jgi:hypothetical protein
MMDVALVNRTGHMTGVLPFALISGRLASSCIVKGVFELANCCTAATVEDPLHLVSGDVWIGDPPRSSSHYESDFVPVKPRADMLCVGKAYSPAGRSVHECLVSFGVGKWSKTIRVVGNRVWQTRFKNLLVASSDPEPFVSMPVSFEYAFGGADPHLTKEPQTFAANPIGKGYCKSGEGIDGLPLPNLEDPAYPIKSWKDQPRPMGFGPVGRTWQPRLRKAGTYDEKWIKERAPLLPLDFDEGFYNCAPEDQQLSGYLRGDEEVRVTNMHLKHPNLVSRLPGIRVRCLFQRDLQNGLIEELKMNLDTLWIDMEQLQMVLVWRGRITSEGLPEDTTFLTVQEQFASPPRPLESYRDIFLEHTKQQDMSDLEAAVAEEEAMAGES